ncbi:hypothetical protein SLE2022_217980 [Rubroshorea leprosula]
MNSSSLFCSLPLSPRLFPGNLQRRPGNRYGGYGGGVSRISVSKRDAYNHNYDGKLVDENMIVLRKRIQEMKVAERNEEAPLHWMEWEKRYYAQYDSDICEIVGLLQSKLMETRPALALAMAVVILLSVPTSTVVILSHFISFFQGL